MITYLRELLKLLEGDAMLKLSTFKEYYDKIYQW